MNDQTHNHRKHKDPFYVQPLPKPFYHPSPTKDVDDKEAIKTSHRRSDPATLGRQEEEFLRGCPVFKTSALSDIRALRDLPESKPDLPRQTDLITGGHLDESWAESEMPSSVSAPGNTSGATFTTEDSEETSRCIEDGVEDVGDNGLCYDRANAGESVLQRYIERFRKSAPKSREERLKEKGDKLPFWWLHSSPGSRSDLTGAEAGERNKQPRESFSEPNVKRQLTKEVLLALDEATLHLQTKTDRLLSKSELSLASSGPVVSTEGIGSSASVSSSTFVEEPYRPAFAKGQDSYHRQEPRLFPRKGERSRSANAGSSSPADDILSRWRLRRKMDEATTDPFCRQLDKPSAGKPSRDPGLNSQLEAFRKKILSQKALVTHEDIHYERQRMAIMMDDMQQDGCVLSKQVPQTAIQPSELSKDSVLERMQKITGSRGSTSASFGEAATFNLRQEEPLHDASISANFGYNFSINNANFTDARLLKNSNKFLTASGLNKNNTASSGRQIQRDTNRNNEHNPGFCVDNFEAQVVCDPKKNGFFLGSSSSEYHDGGHPNVGDERVRDLITGRETDKVDREGITENEKAKIDGVGDSITENEKAKIDRVGDGITENEKAKVEKSAIDQNLAGHICEVYAVTAADSQSRQANNTQSTENNATETYQKSSRDEQINSRISAGNNLITTKRENYTHKVQKGAGKMGHGKQRSSGKMGHENFYQFLEAEKPNSESKEAAMKLNENDTFVVIDRSSSSRSMSSEEGGEKAREFRFVESDRRVHGDSESRVHGYKRLTREQEKRKLRTIDMKGRGQGKDDSIGSEVLADITNEGTRQPGKKPYSHKSDTTKNMSNENKDLNICSNSELCKESENVLVVSSESSPRSQSVRPRVSSSQKQPIQLTIAQTVADHLFDGSALMSSVDSWASMFPQSPSLPHPQHGPADSRMSSTPSQRDKDLTDVIVSPDQADEECESDGEFDDDPLLQILRKQRDLHLRQLKNIEKKLQDTDN